MSIKLSLDQADPVLADPNSRKTANVCPHCQRLLREAHQTDDGVRLCKTCLLEILSKHGGTCSECSVSVEQGKYYPDRAAQREVNQIIVLCPFKQLGCPWQGQLKLYEVHVASCSHAEVSRPNAHAGKKKEERGRGREVHRGTPSNVMDGSAVDVKGSDEAHDLPKSETSGSLEGEAGDFNSQSCSVHPHNHTSPGTVEGRSPSTADHDITESQYKREEVPQSSSLSDSAASQEVVQSSRAGAGGQYHLGHPREVFRHIQPLAREQGVLRREFRVFKDSVESRLSELQTPVWGKEGGGGSLQEIITNMNEKIRSIAGELEKERRNRMELEERLEERLEEMKCDSQKRAQQGERRVAKVEQAVEENVQDIASVREVAERAEHWAYGAGMKDGGECESAGSEEGELVQLEAVGQQEMQFDTTKTAGRAGHLAYGAGVKGGGWEGVGGELGGRVETRVLQLEQRMEQRERQASTTKVLLSELELLLQASLASTHNGSFLWRIPEIARRRRDAIEERITSIYSPPFYTGRNGYKMSLRAYLNGDGIGYKTHLSVFFVLMKGEFDPLLKWPFDYKVSLILVDQEHRKHIVQTFKPTPDSSSFKKPQSDMNVASGCPQFAKLSVLDDESYTKGDVIYLKCIVDTSRIFHP